MLINPYVAARILDDQRGAAQQRAREARLRHESRVHAEPRRRKVGLAIARVGLRIAGVRAVPATS